MVKKIVVIITITCISLIGNSQKKWSLEKCIKYAFEHNIRIRQQELTAKTEKNRLLQSKANLLPNLNANASQNFNFGRTVDRYTNTFSEDNVSSNSFSVSSSVTLFNGFQNINAVKQNQLNLLASYEKIEKIKNDIALNIASAYLQILFNKELFEIANNQLQITEQQVERTKVMVEAGSLPRGDLLEIESQQALEELNVINAENQLAISYLSLIQLMDMDSVGDFQIQNPPLIRIDSASVHLMPVTQIFSEALTKMPRIKSAEYQLESYERALAVSKGKRSPSLTMGASYGTGYSNARQILSDIQYTGETDFIGYTAGSMDTVLAPVIDYMYEDYEFADQLKDNASTSLYFSLNIPIFNNYQVRNSIRNTEISLDNAKYTLELEKKQLYKEIQQAYADATAAFKKFFASQKAVNAMEEAFRYMEEKYNVGLVNSLDYNTSKNQLTKAKSDLLQAKYEFIFSVRILDFYRGEPLTLE